MTFTVSRFSPLASIRSTWPGVQDWAEPQRRCRLSPPPSAAARTPPAWYRKRRHEAVTCELFILPLYRHITQTPALKKVHHFLNPLYPKKMTWLSAWTCEPHSYSEVRLKNHRGPIMQKSQPSFPRSVSELEGQIYSAAKPTSDWSGVRIKTRGKRGMIPTVSSGSLSLFRATGPVPSPNIHWLGCTGTHKHTHQWLRTDTFFFYPHLQSSTSITSFSMRPKTTEILLYIAYITQQRHNAF